MCRYTWRAPKELEGEFYAELKSDIAPKRAPSSMPAATQPSKDKLPACIKLGRVEFTLPGPVTTMPSAQPCR